MTTTNSDSCKQIEDLIKSMIFVNNPDPDLQPQSPSIPDTPLLIKPPLLTATFDKTVSLSEHDLLGNGYSNESSSQSRLIDNEALLRFAAENIKDKNALFGSENFSSEPFGIVEKSPPELTFPKDATYQQDLVIENPLTNSEDVAHTSNSITSSPLPETETKEKTKKKKNRKGWERKARKRLLERDLKYDRRTQAAMQFSLVDSLEEDEYCVVREVGSVYSVSFEENAWELSCFVCNYSAMSERGVFSHLTSGKHKKEIKIIAADYALHRLPDPLHAQEEAITELLLKLHEEIGLSAKHLEQRCSIASEVNELISTNLPDCTVVLTGSSVSGCGLQSSEVDIILNVGLNLAAERLSTCHTLLSKSGIAKDVRRGFEEKIPKVKFKDTKFDLNCNLIIVDPKRSRPVTSLLALYCNLDPRVPPLTTAFKHFAQLCKLDQPELGTLPSFSFSLLLIYFLQQQSPPVLPVVQEDANYSREFDFEAYRATCEWRSKNTDSLGLLWLKLFKFYCLQYQPGQDIVAIRSSKGVKCKDKGWGTKFLAIEDPMEINRNLAHVVPNKCVFNYIMGCFKNTYIYFGHPLLAHGPLNFNLTKEMISEALSSTSANEKSVDESLTPSDSKNDDILNDDDNDMLEDHDADLPIDDVISTISKLTMDDLKINDDEELDAEVENSTLKSTLLSPLLNPELAKKYNSELKENAKRTVTVGYWDVGNRYIAKDMMKYKFTTFAFTKGQALPLVCRLCCQLGHLKKDCPEDSLPPTKNLPPMTPEFLSFLDKVCTLIKEQKQPMQSTLTHNEKDRASLQLWIQDIYPDAELELFGSFCNGFGFDNSDLDFCLTFKDNKSGEGLNHVEIIEALAKKLITVSALSHVVPITSAKVPIVKFSTKRGKMIRECDISLYNTLAQHNTKMLQMYCSIDERVRGIGFAIKHFAKVLDICDASKGSLSSYAYVLMAIFYLQQRQPPVIPVLQELYKGEKPILMVDNWNAWFFDDLSKLSDVWPEYGQNKESIGELWLGLLSFYASEFDFSSLVISIKQKMPLTRFSKLWQSKKIAIEDPFDLNHNLGAGLSRKMSNYIRTCFIYARSHFGSPFYSDKLKRGSSEALLGYFFNEEILNRGRKPPQDRVCRNCGKIGHMAKNCAVKHEDAQYSPAEPQKYDKRNQNADVGNQRFEKPDKRQVVGANRNKKLPQWNQYDRQPPSNSELPYMNCDMPYVNRSHEPLIRHPINMASQYRHHQQQQRVPPPPGFQPHFQNNSLVIRNPLGFPYRPATSSPFPPTSGGNSINSSSPVKPPNVSLLPPTSNSKSWSTNQRLDNYPHTNFQNQHWQYRPAARLNLDQSNIGAGLRMRHQSLQQFPTPRYAALDQERSRTNTDLGRLHHAPW